MFAFLRGQTECLFHGISLCQGNIGLGHNLHSTVQSGNIQLLQFMLKHKTHNIDAFQDGQTSLFRAVCKGDTDMTLLLLEAGAGVDCLCTKEIEDGGIQRSFTWTALHEACRIGDIKLVAVLLDAGASFSGEGVLHGMSPLHVASWHGHIQVVELLLNAGCNVNILDQFRESVLVAPISSGNIWMVQCLLLAGCRLNSQTWGTTRKDLVEELTRYRQDVYGMSGPYTLFLYAVKCVWVDIAILLLQHGFNPNRYRITDILQGIKKSFGADNIEDAKRLITTYVAAGYNFNNLDNAKTALDSIANKLNCYTEITDWLKKELKTIPSLKHLCRSAIRTHLRVVGQQSSVLLRTEKLDIPSLLKQYLALEDVCGRFLPCPGDYTPQLYHEPVYALMGELKQTARPNRCTFCWDTCL